MVTFRKPDAVDRMLEVLAEANTTGDCWDEIGQPLDDGVKRVIPEYVDKLDLRLDPAEEKRHEVGDVHWGKLEQEAKRLTGLGAALGDIAECVAEGMAKIREHWQGDAADAFTRTALSLVGGLREASRSALNAGSAVSAGVGAIRDLYGAGEAGGYRELSETVLAFRDMTPSHEIYRLDGERIDEIPLCGFNCHDEEWGVLDRTILPGVNSYGRRTTAHKYASNKALTKHWFRWYAFDYPQGTDHESDIRLAVNESANEYPPIVTMIGVWYQATEGLRSSVSDVYRSILDLLRQHAEDTVFGDLKRTMGI